MQRNTIIVFTSPYLMVLTYVSEKKLNIKNMETNITEITKSSTPQGCQTNVCI